MRWPDGASAGLIRNDSDVADPIIRKYIEWGAWRYNRCYDGLFGSLATAMPEGSVEIAFDVVDQLPSNASLAHSDFAEAELGSCVQATVSQQTLNAAGPMGSGKILDGFRFESS